MLKIHKICNWLLIIKLSFIFCGFSYLPRMGHENRNNQDIRKFENELQDDLDNRRDFILFEKYKIYPSKENKLAWYYREVKNENLLCKEHKRMQKRRSM